jgi:2-oxoisovalerate dehydrogenase E2 component (dihydrolipoyl transacylase)
MPTKIDFVFRLPDVGEGVTEAEIGDWLVSVGDAVAAEQPIVEILTDKASLELCSPVGGTVVALGAQRGDVVAVGAELIRFDVGDSAADFVEDGRGPAPDPPPGQVPPSASPSAPAPEGRPDPLPATDEGDAERRPLASPSVRQRARDVGIELRAIHGTGPAGRVTHDDLDRAGSPIVEAHRRGRGSDEVTDGEVIGVRRRIAEHVALAKSRIPHITYVDDIDMTQLEELRAEMNTRRPEPRLTLLPFVIRAMVRAIADQPAMNARFDDEIGVVHQHAAVHVGVATQTTQGLVVPVIRDADLLELRECAAELQRLATAARTGHASAEELSGSTITVTSLGALGGLVTTPIINYPEVAIIGVNKQEVRPVWDGRQFVPRRMMNLSSSFDHRVIDGWDAATFIQNIKRLLEQPSLLFVSGL